MKALGAMNASFGAHLPAVLDLARQATTGGFPDMAKGPLVTLINTFVSTFCLALFWPERCNLSAFLIPVLCEFSAAARSAGVELTVA